jgi:hypothetical protein
MSQSEEIQKSLALVRSEASEEFRCDESALLTSVITKNQKSTTAVIAITAVGGILGALAFLGFLFTIKFYDYPSAVLICGVTLFVISVFHSYFFPDKFSEIISLSLFIIGFFLIGVSCADEPFNFSVNTILLLLSALAIITILWAQGRVLIFMACCTLIASVIGILYENQMPNLIHLVTASCLLLSGTLFIFEAKVMALRNRLSEVANPIRLATALASLGVLEFIDRFHWLGLDEKFLWISSLVPLFWSYVIIFPILRKAPLLKCLVAIALVIPAFISPTMASSLAIILIGFGFRSILLGILGSWVLLNSIVLFYYNLDMNLLNKSILLLTTGALFLITYFFINKSSHVNEV